MAEVARTLYLPAGQRFDFWKAALEQAFVPLEVTRPGGGPDFRGRLDGVDLGALRVARSGRSRIPRCGRGDWSPPRRQGATSSAC